MTFSLLLRLLQDIYLLCTIYNDCYDCYDFLQDMNQITVWLVCALIFWTLTSIGLIFDQNAYAWHNESVRCSTLFCIIALFDCIDMANVPYLLTFMLISTLTALYNVLISKNCISEPKPIYEDEQIEDWSEGETEKSKPEERTLFTSLLAQNRPSDIEKKCI